MATALRDPQVGAFVDESPSLGAFLESLIPEAARFPESWILTALLDARYKGYLEKEERLAARVDRSDRLRIPQEFDYRGVAGLSKEAMEKLEVAKPLTLGQASRVPGVRKSDAALLYVVLVRRPPGGSALIRGRKTRAGCRIDSIRHPAPRIRKNSVYFGASSSMPQRAAISPFALSRASL